MIHSIYIESTESILWIFSHVYDIILASNYGESITAVTIITPGTPASVATAMDGYPLTEKGKTKMLILEIGGTRLWIRIAEIPREILYPFIFTFAIIGGFAVRYSFLM